MKPQIKYILVIWERNSCMFSIRVKNSKQFELVV